MGIPIFNIVKIEVDIKLFEHLLLSNQIMATQTVKCPANFSRIIRQLIVTTLTIEVVGMVAIPSEFDVVSVFDYCPTFMTNILPGTRRLFRLITFPA